MPSWPFQQAISDLCATMPKIWFNPFWCCTCCFFRFRYWHGCVIVFALQSVWALVDLILHFDLFPADFKRFSREGHSGKLISLWSISITYGSLGLLAGFLGLFAALKKRKRAWARGYTILTFLEAALAYTILLLGIIALEELPTKVISREEKQARIQILILYYTAYLAFNIYCTLCGYGLFRYCSKRRRARRQRLVRVMTPSDLEDGRDRETETARKNESDKSFRSCNSVDTNHNILGLTGDANNNVLP